LPSNTQNSPCLFLYFTVTQSSIQYHHHFTI
jgi:hypothetical protein